ncbi:MAG: hypothetical protein ACOVNQ_17155 [Pirellula sp.]
MIEFLGSSGIFVGEKSCIASDFFVLVLSEAVLSATVLVLDGCLDLCNADG